MKIELYYIMYFFKHVKKLNLYTQNWIRIILYFKQLPADSNLSTQAT